MTQQRFRKQEKWPSESTLKRMDKVLSQAKGSATIPPNASPTLKFKFDLANQIIAHMNAHALNQRELAKLLHVHESRISEIVHYRLGRVTADTLMGYVEKLDKKARFQVA